MSTRVDKWAERVSRRGFLDKLARIAGKTALAVAAVIAMPRTARADFDQQCFDQCFNDCTSGCYPGCSDLVGPARANCLRACDDGCRSPCIRACTV